MKENKIIDFQKIKEDKESEWLTRFLSEMLERPTGKVKGVAKDINNKLKE